MQAFGYMQWTRNDREAPLGQVLVKLGAGFLISTTASPADELGGAEDQPALSDLVVLGVRFQRR
jgi:hypothetical protein